MLDYDDVASPLRGHPSVVLLLALVALGESEGATGGQVGAAYAVGFEVLLKLARAMVMRHHVRGWHSTSTLGVIPAAAAGCSHLLGLDAERATAAVGIAVAHVSGVMSSFGTMAKSIQPGNAASAAIRLARLAAAAVLDGAVGLRSLTPVRTILDQAAG